jgi:hypothetical protein
MITMFAENLPPEKLSYLPPPHAFAGIIYGRYPSSQPEWIPAFAGMTSKKCKHSDMMIIMKLQIIRA